MQKQNLLYIRKIIPIRGRASSFLVFFVRTLTDWNFPKQNRKEEEEWSKN